MRGAEFAYLSVCGTGQAGHRLPNEALHIGAAFHLAGFADVVACLWPLSDDFAVRAAEAFYRQAAARGRPGAEALHDALHEPRSAALPASGGAAALRPGSRKRYTEPAALKRCEPMLQVNRAAASRTRRSPGAGVKVLRPRKCPARVPSCDGQASLRTMARRWC
ncbi:CHAT domain-containing protein [Nonomuraea sp. NPDC052116]|uniref:CHAT domain-containing protein n=1 Tax=Nonomuraea sp. NPDC052116 TaxID=3155665 RepID=UPI00343044DB